MTRFRSFKLATVTALAACTLSGCYATSAISDSFEAEQEASLKLLQEKNAELRARLGPVTMAAEDIDLLVSAGYPAAQTVEELSLETQQAITETGSKIEILALDRGFCVELTTDTNQVKHVSGPANEYVTLDGPCFTDAVPDGDNVVINGKTFIREDSAPVG